MTEHEQQLLIIKGTIADLPAPEQEIVKECAQIIRKLVHAHGGHGVGQEIGRRLAALGQMAATVAHEVKNPLSAIKSIAQVMSEDEALKTQHARDLSLIVGETDRLNNTVTQLLSFARTQTPASAPRTTAGRTR